MNDSGSPRLRVQYGDVSPEQREFHTFGESAVFIKYYLPGSKRVCHHRAPYLEVRSKSRIFRCRSAL